MRGRRPSRRACSPFLALLLTLLSAALIAACGSDARQTFSIATGGPAGLYYPYGGGMASVWSRHLPAVNAKAEVTGGSVINVIQVARGESELGIAMADVVTDAFLGQGRFSQPLPLRVLFTAYPNIVHIVTLQDSDIASVAELTGRRVSIGAAGSGTAVAAQNVLRGLGVRLDALATVNLSFGETTSALKDGTIDAGFIVGGLGIAAVTELAVTRPMRLVALKTTELARLREQFPAYGGYVIPAATYHNQTNDIQALGIWSAVVVHETMAVPLAYALTCTIYKHREELLKVSEAARAMTIDNIRQLTAVPLHPGTEQYLMKPAGDCKYPHE